jgi:hypothetical protein
MKYQNTWTPTMPNSFLAHYTRYTPSSTL